MCDGNTGTGEQPHVPVAAAAEAKDASASEHQEAEPNAPEAQAECKSAEEVAPAEKVVATEDGKRSKDACGVQSAEIQDTGVDSAGLGTSQQVENADGPKKSFTFAQCGHRPEKIPWISRLVVHDLSSPDLYEGTKPYDVDNENISARDCSIQMICPQGTKDYPGPNYIVTFVIDGAKIGTQNRTVAEDIHKMVGPILKLLGGANSSLEIFDPHGDISTYYLHRPESTHVSLVIPGMSLAQGSADFLETAPKFISLMPPAETLLARRPYAKQVSISCWTNHSSNEKYAAKSPWTET